MPYLLDVTYTHCDWTLGINRGKPKYNHIIRNKILFQSTDSEVNYKMPLENHDMYSAKCGIVCNKGHIYDEISAPVCPVCVENPPNVTSQKNEFDVNSEFYKGIIPFAPHLLVAEIGFEMDVTYYNGAPISQFYCNKTHALNSNKTCCILSWKLTIIFAYDSSFLRHLFSIIKI